MTAHSYGRRNFTLDTDLEMKDAGLVAASAAWTVDGSAKILDIGEGLVEGHVVVDVSAIEIASNDENYRLIIEGSSSATFASDIVPLVEIELGALEVMGPGSSHYDVDASTGRHIIPFTNERDELTYRYIRGYTVVAGTIATGINFTAHLCKS